MWDREAQQYAKEHDVQGRDASSFWRTATSMYQRRLGEAFFAARAAEIVPQEYAVLTGFGTFA